MRVYGFRIWVQGFGVSVFGFAAWDSRVLGLSVQDRDLRTKYLTLLGPKPLTPSVPIEAPSSLQFGVGGGTRFA